MVASSFLFGVEKLLFGETVKAKNISKKMVGQTFLSDAFY